MRKAKTAKRRNLLDNKRFVLVISFIVALLAWIVIGGWIKPNDTRTFDNVVIDYTRNSSNYKNWNLEIVGDMPEAVSVTVSGDGNILLDLASTDIIVYPDYSAVNDAGTYEIPLRVVRDGNGFDIERWSPEAINLQFEKVHTSAYTLTVQSDGVAAETNYYKDEAIPSTLQVEVSGPEGEMALIGGAAVIIDDTTTRDSTYTVSDAEVVLLDKNGDVLETSDLVTINPSLVSVEIPILPEKKLDLAVGLTGEPAGFDSAWFEGLLTIVPTTITVAGDAATLENMDVLPVGNIDVTTFEIGKTNDTFDIVLPEGLKNISGTHRVSVTLNASTLSQRTFEVPLENIKVVGGPEGVAIEPVDIVDENAVLEVTLIGDKDVMETLMVENLAVEIDASAVEVGGDEQQNLPVRVSVPRSGKVFATSSYTLFVTVGDAEEDSSDASGT